MTRLLLIVCLFLIANAGFSTDVYASESTVEISEWTVPWPDTRPRDPDFAADGTIWFVGQSGHYVGHFDPGTESFSRYELPDGSGPHNVIVDPDGSLWIAGNRQGYIGHMDSESGNMVQTSLLDLQINDPHTLVLGNNRQLWFTAQWSNVISVFNVQSGGTQVYHLDTEKARPYGIKIDQRGHPWIALLGTHGLATINPDTGILTEIPVPREDARLRRIAVASDGNIWYVDYNGGYLGRYHPNTQQFREWRAPSERSGPYAMAVDNRDRIWFVETWPDPNLLIGFDPASETFFSSTPIAAGAVRHMVYNPACHCLWFGTDTNKLMRARLPE